MSTELDANMVQQETVTVQKNGDNSVGLDSNVIESTIVTLSKVEVVTLEI